MSRPGWCARFWRSCVGTGENNDARETKTGRGLWDRVKPYFRKALPPQIWSSQNLRGIALAVATGLGAGFVAVVFRLAIDGIRNFFYGTAQALGLPVPYTILLPALGGLIVGPLVYFSAREARGHGIPEVVVAMRTQGGRIRPRVVVTKLAAASITIGSGGSAGMISPVVQMGAGVGSAIGQFFRLPGEALGILLACGVAGAISAIFNAPIGGVMFALEVILVRFNARNLGFVIISSVAADMLSRFLLGNRPMFPVPAYSLVSGWEVLLYILLGVVSALAAVAFILAYYRTEDFFDNIRLPEYLKPALGGLAVGVMGFFLADVLGNGFEGIAKALGGNLTLAVLLLLVVLKLVATSATVGSGGSGGLFAPALFIGAMVGGAFGNLAHILFPGITAPTGAYALVGMGGVLAGAGHMPITTILILFELTHDYQLILPLMSTVVVSTLIVKRLHRESLFSEGARRRGVAMVTDFEIDPLQGITVGEVMTRDFPTVSPSLPLSGLALMFQRTGHHGFPVLDGNGALWGVVTTTDFQRSLVEQPRAKTVADIATREPIIAFPDQSLHEALMQFGALDVGRIPVVERKDNQRLVGVLRRHDIVGAYRRATQERQGL